MRGDGIGAVMTVGSAVALGLIMCLHTPTLPKHWLLDCGVPWFFFASGFWFVGKTYRAKMRQRVRTLLVPYFLWNLIWFPVLFACNWLGWRYCGAQRVVDGSWPCLLRCLGLSPFAWPALVPTWFLRALFVVAATVGGVSALSEREGLTGLRQTIIALIFWAVYWTRSWWCPEGALWEGFFNYGLSLQGCAWFATGLAAGEMLKGGDSVATSGFIRLLRRQMMPVYVLHAAVIVSVCWVAKACGLFGRLATVTGDVVMWFAGIAGSVALGAALRRWAPRAARVLFGGR